MLLDKREEVPSLGTFHHDAYEVFSQECLMELNDVRVVQPATVDSRLYVRIHKWGAELEEESDLLIADLILNIFVDRRRLVYMDKLRF